MIAFLKGALTLGKFGALFSAGPLGLVFGLLDGLLKVLAVALRFLLQGIADVIRNPATLSVCLVCGGLGAWSFSYYHADLVRALRNRVETVSNERDSARAEVAAWQKRHADQKDRADEADRLRREAEDRVAGAKPVPAGPAPRRVYSRPAADQPSISRGSSLF